MGSPVTSLFLSYGVGRTKSLSEKLIVPAALILGYEPGFSFPRRGFNGG